MNPTKYRVHPYGSYGTILERDVHGIWAPCACPFGTRESYAPSHCGEWCPQFEIIPGQPARKFIPRHEMGVQEIPAVPTRVKLHCCGRVITLESEPKA